MPLPFVIDALRELAPQCPGGEAALLEAAEHLTQMMRTMAAPDTRQESFLLPPPDPQR